MNDKNRKNQILENNAEFIFKSGTYDNLFRRWEYLNDVRDCGIEEKEYKLLSDILEFYRNIDDYDEDGNI